jgi:protein CMS1
MPKGKKRSFHDDRAPPKKRRKSAAHEEEDLYDMESGINTSFARMDNQLLADHLAQRTARFGTDLSAVELSDLAISCRYTSLFSPQYQLSSLSLAWMDGACVNAQ